ncbi:MAG TPA: sigma-70 family RNA polymerase sigma factor [Acidimicrobiales bacterium]|jgi:RNA polymerase sigma-70 factor (ECF subfamily)|nr:sigma-70 family RNA polymerase sigma factor [Acidimicrobiales bacterium]
MTDDVGALSDPALVAAVVRREEPALAEVYRRYGSAVWALARRVTNDAQAAEEVSQTVFLNLWTTPERFDPQRGSLRSWLLAQAHGRAVDLVRSEAARRRRQTREAELAVPASAEVETAVHAAALAEDVRRAVEGLPAGEREAILLAYFGGHTYRETAQLLGQPEGTVKSRIRSGLQNLRRTLDAEGVIP